VTAVGYALVGGSGSAAERVRHASRAEEAGFSFALLTESVEAVDTERDGPPPYAWSVLGAIAQATASLRVGTIVDAPATTDAAELVAQAATTAQALMPGRFFLGLSSDGLADRVDAASETLETAVSIIRERWRADAPTEEPGGLEIGATRIHALPEPLPPIYLAAGDAAVAAHAARFGDGLIGTGGPSSVVGSFVAAGGRGPRIGRVAVCWAPTKRRARHLAGDGSVVCGPDPERHLAAIAACLDAGYDHVYLEQIGPDQAGFLRFAEGELLPALELETLRIAS
jgi:alkanesulfonate monooxygenase SsuD/methylene tetrahydromethanopterin reductase-like flavin-dependent oxidoreductase (luciferase family)